MAYNSTIQWCQSTWNPITGCSRVSKGCENCYAERLAAGRLRHHPSRAGLTDDHGRWNGTVRFNEEWIDQPLQWKKPRRIFVVAHGDLFQENVPDEWIDEVFLVMAMAWQHVFQVLTKRPKRMREYVKKVASGPMWPLNHVWLGTSVEDQKTADERIPHLLETPAAVRWISAEPLLAPIDFSPWMSGKAISWLICGGESGPGARYMELEWARSIRDQCQSAGVPFFMKQVSRKGIIPEDLLIREYPRGAH